MRFRLRVWLGWTVFLVLAAEVSVWAAGEGGERAFAGELAFKWVNFAIVFGTLAYFAWKYLPEFFAGRASTIRQELEEAARAFEQSRQRLAEIEQHLAQFDQEIAAINRTAAEELAAEHERIRAAGQAEAEKILAAACAEIEATTRAAKAEMKAYTARLAVSLATSQIRKEMTPERQVAGVEQFVRSLAGGASQS